MAKACPIPTPAQRTYGEIQARALRTAVDKVYAALQEAAEQAAAEIAAAGLDMPPPDRGYFTATVHQKLYCTLCGADPDTFAGGDPRTAILTIRNSQNIARHYWGADIEPYPPTARGAPA